MTLASLLIALVLEQLRPLSEHGAASALRRRLAALQARWGGAGDGPAWWLPVGGATGAVVLAHAALYELHPVLGFAFNVAVVYLALGHRDEVRLYGDIHLALSTGETAQARALLEQWCGSDLEGADANELTRIAIE